MVFLVLIKPEYAFILTVFHILFLELVPKVGPEFIADLSLLANQNNQ